MRQDLRAHFLLLEDRNRPHPIVTLGAVQVMGVSNERLYRTCRRFRDVGCGYYPNHAFVHIDVRPGGTGSRYWVDVSEPGQISSYVTSWPGVEDGRGATFGAGTR